MLDIIDYIFGQGKKEKSKPQTQVYVKSNKWDITVEEAVKKYGSASAVLDELAKDYPYGSFTNGVVMLLFMERNEKRKPTRTTTRRKNATSTQKQTQNRKKKSGVKKT